MQQAQLLLKGEPVAQVRDALRERERRVTERLVHRGTIPLRASKRFDMGPGEDASVEALRYSVRENSVRYTRVSNGVPLKGARR
ncbi:hypothetical protein GCM10023075_26710 [Streptosporangium album]